MFSVPPSDVISRVKQANDLVTAPTQPASKIKDALSDLVPGERVLAHIQALLPNGTYRAIIAQRDIILSLPHSAKSGDTVELQVVENDGKIALALLNSKAAGTGTASDSVATNLSRAGQMIGDLLSPAGKEGQKPQPALLNGNQPLLGHGPLSGADILASLKNAVGQSGMFYESHQVLWAEGKFSTSALTQEPQGQFSDRATLDTAAQAPNSNPFADALNRPAPEYVEHHLDDQAQQYQSTSNAARQTPVPPELTSLVQQQLEALATQNYAWKGQAWPGQNMEWEISDEGSGQATDDYRWQTQLRLQLPSLGNLTATLRLRSDNKIDVNIQTENIDSEMQLSLAGPALNQQMGDAGLNLVTFGVTSNHVGESSDVPG